MIKITNSVDDLKQVAIKFKRENINILAINGGDGTISATLSTFIEVYRDTPLPKIAILCGGTMNVVAINIGIKGRPEELLSLLLERSSSPHPLKTVKVPMLKIEGRYGFLFANGTSALILREYYKVKSGKTAAWWLGARLAFAAIFGLKLARQLIKSETVKFSTDGFEPIKHESLGVYGTTLKCMPLKLPMFVKSCPSHLFQAVSVKCRAKDLVWRMLGIMMTDKIGISKYKIIRFTKKLELAGHNLGPYTLDGELYEPKSDRMEISLGPEIQFIIL